MPRSDGRPWPWEKPYDPYFGADPTVWKWHETPNGGRRLVLRPGKSMFDDPRYGGKREKGSDTKG